MAKEVLKSLLKEYEQKRMKAELELERRKESLYNLVPRLREIENELNNVAIATAKSILNNSKTSLQELNDKVEELRQEKDIIIKEQGLDEFYLKPAYECRKCNDTGYVLDSNKNNMCSCLKQRLLDITYNKSNISNVNKETFETFNLNRFSDEINVNEFKQKISPRKNMEYIKKKSMEFVEKFDDPEYKNLLFTGNTGLRKNIYI